MSNTAARRGRDLVEEYTEEHGGWGAPAADTGIDVVVSLVRDVLLYVEEEYGSDMPEYVLDSAAEGL